MTFRSHRFDVVGSGVVALVDDLGSALPGPAARVWPAWGVPARAVGEWVALQVELVGLLPRSPMCSSDPGLWWPSRSRGWEARQAEAVAWCGACPLLVACRAYAVAAGEPDGVWGGLTAGDRAALRGGVR